MGGRAHFLIALLSLSAVVFILRLVRARQLRAKYALVWVLIGVLLVVLAVAPSTLDHVARWFGINYPPALLFMLALALLLLIVIHFSWELSRLEERTRTLAEELALRDARRADEPSPRP